MNIGEYWKAIVATLIAGVGVTATALQGDNTIGAQDAITMGTVILGSGIFTYLFTKYTGAKAAISGLTIAIASLSTAISDDQLVTHSEWLTALGVGLAGFLAVYQTPNDEPAPGEGG